MVHISGKASPQGEADMVHQPGPVVEGTGVDRRQFLVGAGAAGLGSALASRLPPPASALPGGVAARIDSPTDLAFHVVRRRRPFDLVAPRFVSLQDTFERARRYERLTPAPEDNGGSAEVSAGRLAVSGTDFYTLFRSGTGQLAPYASVIVGVASFAGVPGAAQDTVVAGLAKDADNHVVAWYNHATSTGGIDLDVAGERETLATATVALSAPCRVTFSLTSTTVVLLVDDGDGFVPVVKADLAGRLDLRRPDALGRYRNTFGARASSGTIRLSSVRAGYFGETGLRDPHLVTHADGTPYLRKGKAYVTFTQAGLGFFETAHWGVWTLDLETYELEQVGNLFFQRDGRDTVLGDHAGHLVVDDRNDRWIVLTSTWGDFDGTKVQVNYATVGRSKDLLHGVHLVRSRKLPLPVGQLPTAHVGAWDPCLVLVERRWYLAFVNASRFFVFYPALSRTGVGRDFTELDHLAGADDERIATEGTFLQKFGDDWFLLASNGDDSPAAVRQQHPVYDLHVKQVGVLDAPHPTNIPWPMVFPVPLPGGRDRWLMVTFDGTAFHEDLLGYGTHGEVVVMRATPLTRPHQFPTRRLGSRG
jgi:hypothetical protein